MTTKTELKVFVKDETVIESIIKDFITFAMVAFCVYISQGSTWWTFVTGLMFLIFMAAKLTAIYSKAKPFKTKAELQEWVDSLPDDQPETV